MSDINVTPFIDVMLVLLAIFMALAPLLTAGVAVDLPQSDAAPLPEDDQPLEITVRRDGQVMLATLEVTDETLVPRLRAAAGTRGNAQIYVRGDSAVGYGRMMQIMGLLNAAGFTKLALVAIPPAAQR